MGNKIFIGGLNYATTEQALLSELKKYGEVLSIRIVTDKETGKSKGFGFATLKSIEQVGLVINGMNNTIFEGRRVGVKEAIEKQG